MNRIKLIVSAIGIIATTFYACEKGDTGPEGPQGEKGIQGERVMKEIGARPVMRGAEVLPERLALQVRAELPEQQGPKGRPARQT